jgi:hypothetical protein
MCIRVHVPSPKATVGWNKDKDSDPKRERKTKLHVSWCFPEAGYVSGSPNIALFHLWYSDPTMEI